MMITVSLLQSKNKEENSSDGLLPSDIPPLGYLFLLGSLILYSKIYGCQINEPALSIHGLNLEVIHLLPIHFSYL